MVEELIKVLLLEDNPGDARLVREFLTGTDSARFEVIHVERFGKGIERLGKEAFDVVLLDLGLPDGEGLQLVGQARLAMPHMPIVVLTGHADEGLAIEAVGEGAQDYLFKAEISASLLVRAIRHAIERHRLQEEMVKLQDQLLEIEQMRVLAATAGAAAHEINTPLSVVMGYLEIVMASPLDSDQQDGLKTAFEAAQKIAAIVRKMRVPKRYATTSYAGGIEIVDFNAASEGEKE
jgi:DNA-binding response OmpR family regulator